MSGAETAGTLGRARERARTVLLWALQILAALAFAAAGFFKLSGAPDMVALFDQIGVGQWFRHVTGAIEVGGALLLLSGRTAGFGALLLAGTMVFAALTHLFVIGGSRSRR